MIDLIPCAQSEPGSTNFQQQAETLTILKNYNKREDMMKKYFFDLRTMAVVAGLTFLLMHGEVVFGQEADNTNSKSGAALKLRDQNLLTTEEKKKRFERRKGKVLENIEKRRALLNNFESCIKSANSREDLKSCRNRNKKGLEALRAQRKEMRGKMREKRERRGKEMN
jgi:hypothetical protein